MRRLRTGESGLRFRYRVPICGDTPSRSPKSPPQRPHLQMCGRGENHIQADDVQFAGRISVGKFGATVWAGGGMELRRRKLKVRGREAEEETLPPPWHGVPPALLVYRERSHRRLAAQTYQQKCARCIWGFQMPVEMIIDQWDPSKRRYRTETFCYGPRKLPSLRTRTGTQGSRPSGNDLHRGGLG